jgi:hypothetical protein
MDGERGPQGPHRLKDRQTDVRSVLKDANVREERFTELRRDERTSVVRDSFTYSYRPRL